MTYDNSADPSPETHNMFAHRCENISLAGGSGQQIMLIWLAREHPEVFDAAFEAAIEAEAESA